MTWRVAGIGEVLWDRFPDGDRLGGAPANFTFHVGQLGAVALIISRLGSDPEGDRLAGLLEKHGLAVKFLQRDKEYPTGVVRVELNEGQPSYVIESPAAWDFLKLTEDLKKLTASLDAVCFGTLAQRHPVSRRTIQDFIRLCPKESLRLFDINLRQDFFSPETVEFGLSHATVLKLNGDELFQLAGVFRLAAQTEAVVTKIFQQHPVELIAVTHGAGGCEIFTRAQRVRARTPKIECVDAVGAGDAFSAALVTGLLAKRPLEEIAERANRIGAFVASQPGAMPQLPTELKPL